MVPLRMQAPDWVRKTDEAPHRSTAFRHATLHDRPGLWGDHPLHPTSAVWLREADDGAWDGFGAGRPTPAIDWLMDHSGGRPISLLAPPCWEGPIRLLGGQVKAGSIQTRLRPESVEPSNSPVSKARVRRLTLEDAAAFEAAAPAWALLSWGEYEQLISRGLAFGVPTPGGFASLAWTFESDLEFDKIGVATVDRFRNLGLGRAAASALVDGIVQERRKEPLWVTSAPNPGSIALAIALGFSIRVDETLLRWTPTSV